MIFQFQLIRQMRIPGRKCNGETELPKRPILELGAPHAPAGTTPLLPAKFIRQPTGRGRLATLVYHPVKILSISSRRASESSKWGTAYHRGRHADRPYAATVRTRPRRKVSWSCGLGAEVESERPTRVCVCVDRPYETPRAARSDADVLVNMERVEKIVDHAQ